jgi:hypothetical protein
MKISKIMELYNAQFVIAIFNRIGNLDTMGSELLAKFVGLTGKNPKLVREKVKAILNRLQMQQPNQFPWVL